MSGNSIMTQVHQPPAPSWRSPNNSVMKQSLTSGYTSRNDYPKDPFKLGVRINWNHLMNIFRARMQQNRFLDLESTDVDPIIERVQFLVPNTNTTISRKYTEYASVLMRTERSAKAGLTHMLTYKEFIDGGKGKFYLIKNNVFAGEVKKSPTDGSLMWGHVTVMAPWTLDPLNQEPDYLSDFHITLYEQGHDSNDKRFGYWFRGHCREYFTMFFTPETGEIVVKRVQGKGAKNMDDCLSIGTREYFRKPEYFEYVDALMNSFMTYLISINGFTTVKPDMREYFRREHSRDIEFSKYADWFMNRQNWDILAAHTQPVVATDDSIVITPFPRHYCTQSFYSLNARQEGRDDFKDWVVPEKFMRRGYLGNAFHDRRGLPITPPWTGGVTIFSKKEIACLNALIRFLKRPLSKKELGLLQKYILVGPSNTLLQRITIVVSKP